MVSGSGSVLQKGRLNVFVILLAFPLMVPRWLL